MGTVIISPEAKIRLKLILDSLKIINPEASSKLASKIRDTLQLLARFPQMGRVLPERPKSGLRDIIILKYRIVYLETKGNVVVVTIFHTSMDSEGVLNDSSL